MSAARPRWSLPIAVLALLLSWTAARATPAHLAMAGERRAALGSVLVFGDSYSVPYWKQVRNWAEQLRAAGKVVVSANHAVSGATASGGGGTGTFAGQLDAWFRGGARLADTTIVYFGHNDVHRGLDLAKARAAYAKGIDWLVAAGATQGGRRLLLALIHDWSRNPGAGPSHRSRVATWNQGVRAVAKARANVQLVDLFGRFQRVFASPGRHGLTDVTTANPAASASTHLFHDPLHFGEQGQRIVAEAIESVLRLAGRTPAVGRAGEPAARPVLTLAAVEPAPAWLPAQQLSLPIGATATSKGPWR